MSTLQAIERALAASRKATNFGVTEVPGNLVAYGSLVADARLLWQEVFDNLPVWLRGSCRDDIDADCRPADLDDDDVVRLTLSFSVRAGAVHLLTEEGWNAYLRNPDHRFDDSIVRLAFDREAFLTDAFTVECWSDEPADAPVRKRGEPNPRRYVRSVDPRFLAPAELAPWLLRSEPPKGPSPAFERWCGISCEMIARALSNELLLDHTGAKIVLLGMPAKKLDWGYIEPSSYEILNVLMEAARWAYGGSYDDEVKLTFLTTELAREWPSAHQFYTGLVERLPNALESAKLLYRAHVRSSGRETLKALADLRKGLADEVQKISQQTRDLASVVWKDVAIALGTLVVKILTDSSKASGLGMGFTYVGIGVAFYIAISYWMSVQTNRNFLRVTSKMRETWRTKLYGFLDNADYDALSTIPLKQAEKAYALTEQWTTVIVVVVVTVMTTYSAWNLGWVQPVLEWLSQRITPSP